jgi:MoxR-like ATPase
MQSSIDIQQLQEKIDQQSQFINRIKEELSKVLVGQQNMVDKLLIGLLSNGHILLEGVLV